MKYIYTAEKYKYDDFVIQMGDLFEILPNNLVVNLTTNIGQDHIPDEDIDLLIASSSEYKISDVSKGLEEIYDLLNDLKITSLSDFIRTNHQKIKKLIDYGILYRRSEINIRDYNVGNSDYSKHIIQPWAIWLDYNLNPWDADIIKRVLRTKHEGGMSERSMKKQDYEKIIHICQERLRQLP